MLFPIRYIDRERDAVTTAEANKQSPFMQQVKSLQLDRLRVIFNKLSVTVESQTLATKSLLEKILVAHSEGPEFLRYTLYKVAFNLSVDCQEEFFSEMDEGHPLKLARVACALTSSIPELGALIKAQFYKLCPLCIPKAAEVGLSGEAFLVDMGFRQKVRLSLLFILMGNCGCDEIYAQHHLGGRCAIALDAAFQ